LGFVPQPNLRDLKNIGNQALSANLKAEASSEFALNPPEITDRLYDDFTIRHNRIAETDIIAQNKKQIGSSQIRTSQISTSQIGVTEITSSNLTRQTGFTQISTAEVDVIHNSDNKPYSSEVGVTEVDANHIEIPQTNITQIDSTKISFASGIPSQQFISSHFPSHNSTPEIINALNNSATNIDSFDEQNIESEAIYGIKSTNIPLTNIPDSLWVSSLNPTYAIGDR
jgi:hypothetical protein